MARSRASEAPPARIFSCLRILDTGVVKPVTGQVALPLATVPCPTSADFAGAKISTSGRRTPRFVRSAYDTSTVSTAMLPAESRIQRRARSWLLAFASHIDRSKGTSTGYVSGLGIETVQVYSRS